MKKERAGIGVLESDENTRRAMIAFDTFIQVRLIMPEHEGMVQTISVGCLVDLDENGNYWFRVEDAAGNTIARTEMAGNLYEDSGFPRPNRG